MSLSNLSDLYAAYIQGCEYSVSPWYEAFPILPANLHAVSADYAMNQEDIVMATNAAATEAALARAEKKAQAADEKKAYLKDRAAAKGMSGAGMEADPVDLDHYDDDVMEVDPFPAPVALSRDIQSSSSAGLASALKRKARSPSPGKFRHPVSPKKRRCNPIGMYVGTKRIKGVPMILCPTVFASVDSHGKINRRYSKETIIGGQTTKYMDAMATSAAHDEIDYHPRFSGMTKDLLDIHIRALLKATDAGDLAAHTAASNSTTLRLPAPRTFKIDEDGTLVVVD